MKKTIWTGTAFVLSVGLTWGMAQGQSSPSLLPVPRPTSTMRTASYWRQVETPPAGTASEETLPRGVGEPSVLTPAAGANAGMSAKPVMVNGGGPAPVGTPGTLLPGAYGNAAGASSAPIGSGYVPGPSYTPAAAPTTTVYGGTTMVAPAGPVGGGGAYGAAATGPVVYDQNYAVGGYGGADCEGGLGYGSGFGTVGGFMGGGCAGYGGAGWFGGANGLIMTRSGGSSQHLSYVENTGDCAIAYNQAGNQWAGGFEVYLGRTLCPGWAIEARYWQLYPGSSSASYSSDGTDLLSTNFNNLPMIDIDVPDPITGVVTQTNVGTMFDGALYHSMTRSYSVRNFELNLFHAPLCQFGCGPVPLFGGCHAAAGYGGGCDPCDPCGVSCAPCCAGSPFTFNVLAGVRYLRYGESFSFCSDVDDYVIDGTNPWEIHYDNKATNDLVGFQIGGNGCVLLTNCLSFNAGAKAGIFGNHIEACQHIYNSQGTYGYFWPDPDQPFAIYSDKNTVSFLSEIDLSMSYRFCSNWRITGGYRGIGLTGLALPGNNIPNDFAHQDEIRKINSSGSVILHGAYAGLEFCF